MSKYKRNRNNGNSNNGAQLVGVYPAGTQMPQPAQPGFKPKVVQMEGFPFAVQIQGGLFANRFEGLGPHGETVSLSTQYAVEWSSTKNTFQTMQFAKTPGTPGLQDYVYAFKGTDGSMYWFAQADAPPTFKRIEKSQMTQFWRLEAAEMPMFHNDHEPESVWRYHHNATGQLPRWLRGIGREAFDSLRFARPVAQMRLGGRTIQLYSAYEPTGLELIKWLIDAEGGAVFSTGKANPGSMGNNEASYADTSDSQPLFDTRNYDIDGAWMGDGYDDDGWKDDFIAAHDFRVGDNIKRHWSYEYWRRCANQIVNVSCKAFGIEAPDADDVIRELFVELEKCRDQRAAEQLFRWYVLKHVISTWKGCDLAEIMAFVEGLQDREAMDDLVELEAIEHRLDI